MSSISKFVQMAYDCVQWTRYSKEQTSPERAKQEFLFENIEKFYPEISKDNKYIEDSVDDHYMAMRFMNRRNMELLANGKGCKQMVRLAEGFLIDDNPDLSADSRIFRFDLPEIVTIRNRFLKDSFVIDLQNGSLARAFNDAGVKRDKPACFTMMGYLMHSGVGTHLEELLKQMKEYSTYCRIFFNCAFSNEMLMHPLDNSKVLTLTQESLEQLCKKLGFRITENTKVLNIGDKGLKPGTNEFSDERLQINYICLESTREIEIPSTMNMQMQPAKPTLAAADMQFSRQ